MKTALIGYTGFVGSNILEQMKFDSLFNSSNINTIDNSSYGLVICSGARGLKWKANKNPEEDKTNIFNLIKHLETVKAGKFILISTIDVYSQPKNVDEDSSINIEELSPYGKHRHLLEDFVLNKFSSTTIVRLPALFGSNLKKNFIYDLIHNDRLSLTHFKNTFQYYNLQHIMKDIDVAIKLNLPLVNFATEPVTAHEVALYTLGINFKNETKQPPQIYDVQTKYASLYGGTKKYIRDKNKTLEELKRFIINSKSTA